MNNKHWEEELSEVVKGMTPIQPNFDMRTGVMQQIRYAEVKHRTGVQPLLSASVKKILLITIPMLMVVAFISTRNVTNVSGSIFINKLGFLRDITIPQIELSLSDPFRWALIACSLFFLLQIVNIGRLINKTDREIH